MVAEVSSPLVHGLKLSSVVPGKMTGDNRNHGLTGLDLAVKLHYIRGVYFFRAAADVPVEVDALKEPMFRLLELYYPATGRIRRGDGNGEEGGGRPFVRCNDSGVRIVEARCEKTVDEWLGMEGHAETDNKVLVYDHVLGPDLGFTPLVFIQFTWFKCGGISLGLSWAHVLGDAFSASSFINMWGHIMAGHVPPKSLHVPTPGKPVGSPGPRPDEARSLRRVEHVGDYWLTANDNKMRTCSLHITGDRLDRLMTSHGERSSFQVLSAVVWKSLSRIRGERRVRTVTVCTGGSQGEADQRLPGNSMAVGTVDADFPVSEADVTELAAWMKQHNAYENRKIEESVKGDGAASDFILYGANLTFVNLEDAKIYGLELKGQKPIYANYAINGVGDEGVVLVLPWPGNGQRAASESGGRKVTMTLPGYELPELATELKDNWGFI